jgi:Xaa-Pro aminopeptidase
MTFTDEPSILVDDRFGVRIEDVVVCEPGRAEAEPFPPDSSSRERGVNESTAPLLSFD